MVKEDTSVDEKRAVADKNQKEIREEEEKRNAALMAAQAEEVKNKKAAKVNQKESKDGTLHRPASKANVKVDKDSKKTELKDKWVDKNLKKRPIKTRNDNNQGWRSPKNKNKNKDDTDDQNFVAWCWKAGGNKNTFNVDDVGYASAAAAGLTGAVNCTQEGASVGTKQGFSITVQEATSSSGATMQIPHGLTQKPDFIIGKDIDTASTNWGVYHASLGATKKIDLDQTGGSATNANYWDETEPTSSVIYTNAASFMYTSSSFVLYSWHNVPGLQKFGLYNGSGGGNGPFIELGFKPSILIIKRTDSSGDHWFIHDGVRNTGNPANRRLYPSWNQTEFSNVDALDLLSNGFKIKTGDTSWNADTGTYIYAAWAEAPTFNLYGGQSNAR